MFRKYQAIVLGGFPLWTGNLDEILFRALIGAYFVTPVLFVSIEASPTALAIIAAIIGAANLSIKGLYPSRGSVTLATVLAILSCFVLSSALWSVDPARSIGAARDVFGYSVAALVLLQCLVVISAAQCDRLLQAFVAGARLALAVLIGRELYFAFASGEPLLVEKAVTLHKITFYGAFFAAGLLAQPGLISKIFAAAFAISTLLYGRSTGIDLAIVVIALFFAAPERFRHRALVCFVVLYMALAVVAPLVVPPLFAFLDARGLLAFHPGTIAARMELWKMISPDIAEAPILGHGANTMRNAVGVVVNPKYYMQPDLPSAHNIVFDLWYELGIVGIIVYGMILAAITRMIGRLSGTSQFIAASFFMIAVIELSVDHRIWLSWMLGTLVFTASICLLHHRSVAGTQHAV
ncbi:MAG: O-antigen ligase family protein [Mesorhizobium sp.]